MEKKILRILSFVMVAMFAFTIMGMAVSAEEISADIPEIEEITEEELIETLPEEEFELYADGPGAIIGDDEYPTLREAIAAAQDGDTVEMLESYTLTSELGFTTGKKFTVDGGGYEIIDSNTGSHSISVKGDTQVVFENVKFTKEGGRTGGYAYFYMSAGHLTLGEGTVLGGTADNVYLYGNGGILYTEGTGNCYFTVDGATIQYMKAQWQNGVISGSATTEVNLLNGTISNCTYSSNPLIKDDARFTVNLGNINIINSATPTVSLTNTKSVKVSGGGTLGKINGPSSKISFVKSFTYGPDGKTFTGGDFAGTVTLGITDATEPASFAAVESGMAITGSVKNAADGGALILDANGNLVRHFEAQVGETKYVSFVTAVNSAKNGETVNLLCDVKLTDYNSFSSGQKFTIDGSDGNGGRYTITSTHTSTKGSIGIAGTTDVTFTNVRLTDDTGMTRDNGYFHLYDTAKLTLGDYAELSGTEAQPIQGINGGAVFAEGSSTFVMDGEGALIEYTKGLWHGNIAAYGTGSKIYIKNGTIRNTWNENGTAAVMVSSGGTEAYISGGSIVNSKSGSGVKIAAGKKLYLSGNAVVTGNTSGNITVSDASAIILNGNFTGEAGVTVTGAPTVFGKVADAAYTVSGNLFLNDTPYVKAYANAEDLTLRWASECRIGSTDYITFLQALSSVKDGETITLKKNLSYTSTVNFANGRTFTVSGDDGDDNTATKYTINVESTSKGSASVYVNAGTNVTFENINITGSQTTAHDYGFIGLTGTVTIGDYCTIGGTAEAYMKGTNGGLVWATGNGTFILDGEEALIQYVQGNYWGNIALRSATAKAYIKNGTITNCKATGYGQVTSATDGTNDGGNIYITGGNIINNEDSGVYIKQGAGKLEISGDAVIENNKTANIYFLNNATLVVAGDFTGRASIVPVTSVFGSLGDASYTGYENIKSGVNNQLVTLDDDGVTLYIPYEAKIGETYYWKLRDAAGKTGTIEMLADVTNWGAHYDVAERTVTINGNGHTIHVGPRVSNSSNFVFVAFNGGVLNLNNVIIDGDGRPAVIAHPTGGGTVTATDCTFINCTEIDNGVLAVGGGSMTLTNCTIEAGKGARYGVIVVGTSGNAHEKGIQLTMTDCTVTGCTGNKPVVFVNNNGVATLENVEITGNTATESALYVAEGGDLTIKGTTTVSDNTKNMVYDNADNITVLSGFEGQINISNGTVAAGNKLAVAEAGATLVDINCFKADAKSTLIPYIKDGAIYWTANPVLTGATDSGIYTDGSGVIRFMTTFVEVPESEAITGFGTYIMSKAAFEDGVADSDLTKVVTFEIGAENVKAPTAAGQAFIVDAIADSTELDTMVQAISYVKLSGIETPVYYDYKSAVSVNNSGNGDVRILGDKA